MSVGGASAAGGAGASASTGTSTTSSTTGTGATGATSSSGTTGTTTSGTTGTTAAPGATGTASQTNAADGSTVNGQTDASNGPASTPDATAPGALATQFSIAIAEAQKAQMAQAPQPVQMASDPVSAVVDGSGLVAMGWGMRGLAWGGLALNAVENMTGVGVLDDVAVVPGLLALDRAGMAAITAGRLAQQLDGTPAHELGKSERVEGDVQQQTIKDQEALTTPNVDTTVPGFVPAAPVAPLPGFVPQRLEGLNQETLTHPTVDDALPGFVAPGLPVDTTVLENQNTTFDKVDFNVNRLPKDQQAAVYETLAHINAGTRPATPVIGKNWGQTFRNRFGDLPKTDAEGKEITYGRYRVDAEPFGETGAGSKRIVVGSDGRVYFTGSHYGDNPGKPFVRIK
jgi:guanyl-specific ribonuclease Sa